MKKFMIKHEATIGLSKQDGGDHPCVNLTFFTIVEAENTEAAQNQVVAYSDPHFRTRITDVSELGDTVDANELYKLMQHSVVFTEM